MSLFILNPHANISEQVRYLCEGSHYAHALASSIEDVLINENGFTWEACTQATWLASLLVEFLKQRSAVAFELELKELGQPGWREVLEKLPQDQKLQALQYLSNALNPDQGGES